MDSQKESARPEGFFRALLEGIPAIAYVAFGQTPLSRIYISPQWKTFFGVPLDDPEAWGRYLHPADRKRVMNEIRRSAARGEPFRSEYRMVTGDGRTLWFRDEAAMVRGEKGRPSLLRGVMLDITERKAKEQASGRDADLAMRKAKSGGKRRYQIYDGETQAQAIVLLQTETYLQTAIDRREFRVHFLPTVSLKDGEIVSVEALVRWEHPEFGLVPPSAFLDAAERSGLIIPIGEWVLRTSCAQIRAWHDEGFPNLKLSVNLSARQFGHPDLAVLIERVLEENGLPVRCLVAEITENTAMRDADFTRRRIEDLRAMGVEISIDDFGTGYASPEYLRTFHVDKIKIDRSFTHEIPDHADAAQIVKAMIAMAHTLGMAVIAEGVEKPEQVTFLRACGCDDMQGFLFSQPVAARAMETLLRAGEAIGRLNTPTPEERTPTALTGRLGGITIDATTKYRGDHARNLHQIARRPGSTAHRVGTAS